MRHEKRMPTPGDDAVARLQNAGRKTAAAKKAVAPSAAQAPVRTSTPRPDHLPNLHANRLAEAKKRRPPAAEPVAQATRIEPSSPTTA